MKAAILISVFTFVSGMLLFPSCNQEQAVTTEFVVLGECGMCKDRIEAAAQTEGVVSATWDSETQLLTLEYLPSQVQEAEIHSRIAAAGHDTEKEKAMDADYDALPACCKYLRDDYQGEHAH